MSFILAALVAAIIILLLGVFVFAINRKRRRAPDYRAFFAIGIIWVPLGIIFDNFALIGFGIVMMFAGLLNKNKWKKSGGLKQFGNREKATIIAIIVATVLIFLGFLLYASGLIE